MASFISATVIGADKIAAHWKKVALEADNDAYRVTRVWTGLLTTSIKAHASGRPGPRTPTGSYRRSWTYVVERKPGTVIGTSGTTSPQGWRLELGFVGVDSLGRHYHAPPFPHVGVALSKIEDQYANAVGGIVARL